MICVGVYAVNKVIQQFANFVVNIKIISSIFKIGNCKTVFLKINLYLPTITFIKRKLKLTLWLNQQQKQLKRLL